MLSRTGRMNVIKMMTIMILMKMFLYFILWQIPTNSDRWVQSLGVGTVHRLFAEPRTKTLESWNRGIWCWFAKLRVR